MTGTLAGFVSRKRPRRASPPPSSYLEALDALGRAAAPAHLACTPLAYLAELYLQADDPPRAQQTALRLQSTCGGEAGATVTARAAFSAAQVSWPSLEPPTAPPSPLPLPPPTLPPLPPPPLPPPPPRHLHLHRRRRRRRRHRRLWSRRRRLRRPVPLLVRRPTSAAAAAAATAPSSAAWLARSRGGPTCTSGGRRVARPRRPSTCKERRRRTWRPFTFT